MVPVGGSVAEDLAQAMSAPQLEGDACRAVEHRGTPIQIIAGAGSGKTEVVSQRVAQLLATGEPASSIVAFTFTERAAGELKNRIALRVEERLGRSALDQLGGLFVGTIHAYCFRFLQQHVPRFETYDVLDDNQLTALLAREANRLKIKSLDPRNRMFAGIAAFLHSVAVVENELLDPDAMPDPFGTVLHDYLATLDRYRLLTYGQQIANAVRELERPEVAAVIHATLRHLIVDEYQDVNPAQERLIELLAGPDTELCVVGDDDQAVYQWRGSDVSNIIEFAHRYPNVARFEITTNRRSRPGIICTANAFGRSIEGRLDKTMGASRTSVGAAPEVVVWHTETEQEEAGWIAQLILDANEQGLRFQDMAVLVRGRASYPKLLEAFGSFGIPVQPGGRVGLFQQPEARVLGRTIVWLTDLGWREDYGWGEPVKEADLLEEYLSVFELPASRRRQLRTLLREWRDAVPETQRNADLVGELYTILEALDVRCWDLDDAIQANRIGTLARFSALLADYESVRRRARRDDEVPGEQVGGQPGGEWYYKNLGFFILNHATGAYDGFDGEDNFNTDAVDLTTVHGAKGLEWPLVFVPSMTKARFPAGRTGNAQDWLVPRDQFRPERYEGSDADERRLFYVAMTRARDCLSISRHVTPNKQRQKPSPYYEELQHLEVDPDDIVLPPLEPRASNDDEPITITFSELAQYLDCGMAFRLRNLLGFQPRLAPELGYGKAVHHVLRTVAEKTKRDGRVPSPTELDGILDTSFFLPTANKPAHRELKRVAGELVKSYAKNYEADLNRIWETERPFELHLGGVIVAGRADVILDRENGVATSLAILDYKTSTNGERRLNDLQLQVYTDAGRREGLDVRAAYVHDLKRGERLVTDVSAGAVAEAEAEVRGAADRLRVRDYRAEPERERCRGCEVRKVCASSAA